jgi:hypothetical protein
MFTVYGNDKRMTACHPGLHKSRVPGRLGVTKFCTLAPHICGSSVFFMSPTIFRWLLDFWRICTPLSHTTDPRENLSSTKNRMIYTHIPMSLCGSQNSAQIDNRPAFDMTKPSTSFGSYFNVIITVVSTYTGFPIYGAAQTRRQALKYIKSASFYKLVRSVTIWKLRTTVMDINALYINPWKAKIKLSYI